jgi:hypothetical protein
MHWFQEDYRKVLMILVSPEWAKQRGQKFNASACIDALDAAQTRCVQTFAKDHYGYCYFKSSLGRPYPTDVIGQLIAAARPRGMRFIPYYSVGFDAYATGTHPEWLYVDSHGQPRATPTGPFLWACLNSPYRDYCLQQIEEMVNNYDVDGVWLDILPLRPASVGVDGRPGLTYVPDAPCYCPTCQVLYRQRYGEDVPLIPSQADRVRGFQLRVDGARSFIQEVARITKARRPDAIVTYNGSGKPVDALDCADLSSVEAHAPDYMKTSFFSRWGRHSGRMTELYTPLGLPGSGLGFNGWDVKPVEMLKLETAITMAHGGVLWHCQNPYPDGSTDQAQFDTLKQIFAFVKTLEPYVQDAQSVSDVALLMTNQPYSAPTYGQEAALATEALHQALVHGHVQFDIVRLPADLSKYRVLILAEQAVMSTEEAEAVRRFVADGGCLFVTGATSLMDEAGTARDTFALSDVLGADYRRHSQQPFVYMRLADEKMSDHIPDVPILVQMPSVEVELTTGRALGYVEYPELKRTSVLTILWGYPPPDKEQRHPALVLNHYGKGLCIYSAVGFPHRTNDWGTIMARGRETAQSAAGNALEVIWTERLARNIVSRLLAEPVLDTDAPVGVEVAVNRWQGSYLVHLMNHYAGDAANPSYAGERLVLRNIILRLNTERLGRLSRARLLPQEQALNTRVLDKSIEITVPDFDVHCLLQVE